MSNEQSLYEGIPSGPVGGGAMLTLALTCPYLACRVGSEADEWKPSVHGVHIISIHTVNSYTQTCIHKQMPRTWLYSAGVG